jgi:uncharacterized membrane protein YeaQ/YmgE (transglycosylase-associated protein family)
VVELSAGIQGKLIMPGRDPGGFLLTIVIGIVGDLIGGFVVQLLGGTGVTGFNVWSIWRPPEGRSYCWLSIEWLLGGYRTRYVIQVGGIIGVQLTKAGHLTRP